MNKKNKKQKIKLSREIIVTEKNTNINETEMFTERKHIGKVYFSYSTRLVIYFILFIIFFTLGDYFLIKSFKLEDDSTINCKENSSIDYKVYLKENEFYKQKYLEKDMIYIANLIDKIDINFDYDYDINKPLSLDFTYSIIGKLVITDNTNNNKFFEKEYKLLPETKIRLDNKKHLDINKSITIDYEKYNEITNSFKSISDLETKSNLIVYMVINSKNNQKETEYKVDNTSKMDITIPIIEKDIDINMDYKEINSTKEITSNKNLFITNIIYVILGIILVTIAIIYLVKAVKLIDRSRGKKSAYDKYVNKLLKEYDKLIVETPSIPSFDDKEIIKIEEFGELLDVRNTLIRPIMYYIITKHQKGCFYIRDGNTIYLYTVKDVDLENK